MGETTAPCEGAGGGTAGRCGVPAWPPRRTQCQRCWGPRPQSKHEGWQHPALRGSGASGTQRAPRCSGGGSWCWMGTDTRTCSRQDLIPQEVRAAPRGGQRWGHAAAVGSPTGAVGWHWERGSVHPGLQLAPLPPQEMEGPTRGSGTGVRQLQQQLRDIAQVGLGRGPCGPRHPRATQCQCPSRDRLTLPRRVPGRVTPCAGPSTACPGTLGEGDGRGWRGCPQLWGGPPCAWPSAGAVALPASHSTQPQAGGLCQPHCTPAATGGTGTRWRTPPCSALSLGILPGAAGTSLWVRCWQQL